MMNKEFFMREALKEALKSYSINEVPIGCVIVKDGEIIARAHNNREQNRDPLGHAELIAIKKAAKHLGGWRLVGCDMYVTLEPCPMCKSVINESRIRNVYFLSSKSKSIHYKTKYSLCYNIKFSDLLTSFFKKIRLNNKQ